MLSFQDFQPEHETNMPIYRQIAGWIVSEIDKGRIQAGERLPATRELAEQLGLNRATVSAAYAVLEESGRIFGHVGRGSFVAAFSPDSILAPRNAPRINFANSRPAEDAFPLSSFRRLSKAVIDSAEASSILQLGSPQGYGPLRRHLLEQDLVAQVARPGDDVLITSGCQQALDLLARAYVSRPHQPDASVVLVEDPVYHGLLRIFHRAGARLVSIPVTERGLDVDCAEELMERLHPRMLVLTPDFQNPTGWTIPLLERQRLIRAAQKSGVLVVENGIYSRLRYVGEAVPTVKALDESGRSVLLRSYSKMLFPGLRVGWVTAPRDVIRRLTEEKQIADLHSDQLSQAIFLRFAQSGEMDDHIRRTCATGQERLRIILSACARSWPDGSRWTQPEGGMSLWVDLPAALTADALQRRVGRDVVEFLAGANFSAAPGAHPSALRLSFGGLSPELIGRGVEILGSAAEMEINSLRQGSGFELEATAVV